MLQNHLYKIAVPGNHLLDYLPSDEEIEPLKPGTRVLVPLRKKKAVGIIWRKITASNLEPKRLKSILTVPYEPPLFTPRLLELLDWLSDYYLAPLGEVVKLALPKWLRMPTEKGNLALLKKLQEGLITPLATFSKTLSLNSEQQLAVDTILQNLDHFRPFLLAGITGSGKTEIYLQVIAKILDEGKQALVLLPEINLTPQTVKRFAERFPVTIAVLHSQMTDKARAKAWNMARTGSAKVIIGTRSAIFTPLPNLGLIVVDEEHDLSFKQQSGIRYGARDVAVMCAKINNIPIILGSATPSCESLANVDNGRYCMLKLPHRIGDASLPTFKLIDLRAQHLESGIAPAIMQELKRCLLAGEQALIFINQRGYAPLYICKNCGWIAVCPDCDAHLIYHKTTHFLHCHHCGRAFPPATSCPNCNSNQLAFFGSGTEKIAEVLHNCFPGASLARMDRDTTAPTGALSKLLSEINEGKYQIIIGTQMLSKGHHFPKVTLVVILNVDQGLNSFDFRGYEHLAQLIVQISGRAGRANLPGKVLLQTYAPQHPFFKLLIKQGYLALVREQLRERRAAQLPPFTALALLQTESRQPNLAQQFLIEVKQYLNENCTLDVTGPIPAMLEKKAGWIRAQMLLQSPFRAELHQQLKILQDYLNAKKTRKVRWFIDVDPQDLG